ncbi:hypothetical protein L0337_08825 [candidate division KSB1 bacterium]|nr:hypothetical protein [candidate division KSB1 bacterium]
MCERNLFSLVLLLSLFLFGCINKREDAAKAESPAAKSHRKNSASLLASPRQISDTELLANGRIRTLLQKGKYQELNTLLESYQKAFEQDVQNEEAATTIKAISNPLFRMPGRPAIWASKRPAKNTNR